MMHQVGQTTPDPIQSPRNEGIPAPQHLTALFKLRVCHILAAGCFLADHAAPGLPERVALLI
jgi:hypothetical protein